jgi:hypothetical protein
MKLKTPLIPQTVALIQARFWLSPLAMNPHFRSYFKALGFARILNINTQVGQLLMDRPRDRSIAS